MLSVTLIQRKDLRTLAPERHAGAVQDLTGQSVGGPVCPSMNVASSDPPLCLLEADTRSPQILGSPHLLAAGTGK